LRLATNAHLPELPEAKRENQKYEKKKNFAVVINVFFHITQNNHYLFIKTPEHKEIW